MFISCKKKARVEKADGVHVFVRLPLLGIKPEGGTCIYSAFEPFNEGVRSTLIGSGTRLARVDIIPAGFSVAKEEGGRYNPAFDRELHASGYASREDLT